MDANTYRARRQALREAIPDGAILLPGNAEAPRNYVDNPYPFRQDSHFLYYAGIAHPRLVLLIEPGGEVSLYGPPEDPDDLVWFGPQPSLEDHGREAGVDRVDTLDALKERLHSLDTVDGRVHYLPPYRDERRLLLADLLGADPRSVDAGVSQDLLRAVVNQRNVKSDDEIAELEDALGVTAEMFRAAMSTTRAGRTEAEIAAVLQHAALAANRQLAYIPIVTVHGEVLHNHSYANTLADGHILVIDAGSESRAFYASDITRSWPVSGSFSPKQRAVYEIVLAAQKAAIELASPVTTNREVHLCAARTITEGLREMGLMKGEVDDAVAEGAHALFFPHGIGHMLGLDVHDIEDLGDEVGYPGGEPRSEQFGLSLLRMVRPLEPGFVITVEPGVYFIPALIERWRAENLHSAFINYDRLDGFLDFGGIRIEDNVLITEMGSRVLGPGIPKTVEEIEAAVGTQ